VTEGGIELSPRLRPLLRLGTLLVLSGGLLFAPGAAQAAVTLKPVAWGCGAGTGYGQCTVPSGISGVTAIAASGTYYHSLALKDDGTVIAWGCGDGTDFGQCSVPSGLSGVTAIAAGGTHSLALKADGTVVAWGCGDGADHGQCSVPSGLSGVTAIAAGATHSLALKGDGTVVAWGCGAGYDFGQCSVPASLAGVSAIAAGATHSLALKGDGTVVAWGCGGFGSGQCSVPSGLAGVTAIAAATDDSLALKGDGTVVAWGCGAGNDFGQCSVPAALAGVTAISAGYAHSLALKGDGTVVAWGCGAGYDVGQCSVPSGLFGVTAVSAGLWHSLAVAEFTDQTITFGPLANKTYGDPDFIASATASSGLPVSFSASGNCSVSAAIVHIFVAGSCTITASQAGGVNYNPAPDISRTFAIARAGQSITFAPLANKTFGDPDFRVSATASSGLPVFFDPSGACGLSGPTTVHLIGAGSCTVTAVQPGNANYKPAADVSRTFAIAKLGQAITFGPLRNKTYGAPDFDVSAAASSRLPVSFAASGKCAVEEATVHLMGAGSCTVTASQPGDANYNSAPAVSRSFSIKRPPCRVPKVVGRRFGPAKKMIAKKHCRTGKVGHAYSRERKKGIVISQSRRPGRVLPANTKINLVVSRGRRR
jgi:hypothetical protein